MDGECLPYLILFHFFREFDYLIMYEMSIILKLNKIVSFDVRLKTMVSLFCSYAMICSSYLHLLYDFKIYTVDKISWD